MRILQVFGSLNMGGAESRMMDVYRKIDKSEHQFDFICLESGKQFFEEEIQYLGGKIYKIKSPRETGIIKHICDLRRIMRLTNYSAVHAHTSYHCGLVMMAAYMEHIPVRVAHARTTGSKQHGSSKNVFLSFGKLLIALFATHRLAISTNAGKFLFGNSKFEVVPNAIDVENYNKRFDAKKVKRSLGIGDDETVLAQIGRFDSMKNHSFTISLFDYYLDLHPKSKLLLIGDGVLKKDIIDDIKKKGLMERVILTGVRTDIPEILSIVDVMIFPSLFEGLGGVVIEAQASCTPTVESDRIPTEADLGLGIVRRCSLDEDIDSWIQAIDESIHCNKPTWDCIYQRFKETGYAIEAAVERYLRVYQGDEL